MTILSNLVVTTVANG